MVPTRFPDWFGVAGTWLKHGPTLASTERARPQFRVHILVVYRTRQEGHRQTFSRSIVEFWVHDTIQCWAQGSYGTVDEIGGWYRTVENFMFKLEDIRALGFQVGTVLGASPRLDGHPACNPFI